jgi:OOP family OmpA-OmpF porin
MKVAKVVSAILLSFVTALCVAQGTQGYVVDGSGKIVKTGTGLCLHTGSYTSANAVEGCDPVAKKPAVVVTAVTLSSDVLFAFDSAVLTQQGRTALDAAAPKITGNVKVVGHADRIGASSYNQTLSEARANAVAQYLGSKSRATFAASGVGSTQPTEGTKLCTGMKNFEKYKACLAPDRRVVLSN